LRVYCAPVKVTARLFLLMPFLILMVGVSAMARVGGGVLYLSGGHMHGHHQGEHRHGEHHHHEHDHGPLHGVPVHEHAPCSPRHVHLPLVEAPVVKSERASVEESARGGAGGGGPGAAVAVMVRPAEGLRVRFCAGPWRAQSRTERLRTTRIVV
jgi:hypothetical protein